MSRSLLVLMIAAVFVALSTAQLNFSTGWGKRAGGAQQDGCRSSMDALMYIYRLIQNEAQKIVECEKYAN